MIEEDASFVWSVDKHEVSGERGLDRVVGGLGVADLAHHHDVGILAKDRAQRARERDVDLRPDGHLVEVLEHHLHRVFDGDDVDLGLREVLEGRVERRRLAASRGTGHEHDSRGPGDEVVELRQVMGGEAEVVDALQQDVGIEDAEHGLLAEGRRHGRNAQLDLASALLSLDAPVLRPSLLGEVAARKQLDARDHRLVHDPRDEVDVVEDAVDAQTHEGQLALGLEVDVRGPLLEGVGEDVVEGLDHRRGRGVEVLGRAGEELLVAEVDGGDSALLELLLGGLEARLQVVEALVDGLDVGARWRPRAPRPDR